LALAVANLAVVDAVGLADPEERLLARSPCLPEELVGGERAVDVAEYHFFIGSLLRLMQLCQDTTSTKISPIYQMFESQGVALVLLGRNVGIRIQKGLN